MNNLSDSAGSQWRRWDLHLHAPGTKLSDSFKDDSDEAWSKYLALLEASPVQVFGITDYFSADTYFAAIEHCERAHPEWSKVFFPNMEFRLSESISRDGTLPDIHVIFDNDPAVFNRDVAERFLTNLETQSIDDANVTPRCSDLKSRKDFESASVSLKNLLKALRDTFGENKPYLIAFPANNNGLRSTDSNSPRKVSLADSIDRSCDIFFGRSDNRDFLLRTDRYGSGESKPKPVVSGSDAHSFEDLERLGGHVRHYPPTWIKADPTFIGLKQICHEPASRVSIEIEPPVISRQDQDGTRFLQSLQIDQIEGYDETSGEWFKDVQIPLNPELTAIIGNKGSGKSAIVDIIGLLGESRQEPHFSFLTNESKNRKFRQKGYAENFQATLNWCAGKPITKNLSETCDLDNPETVRYLPQSFFEKLTNEIEIVQFRREIEDVVFSHVDETEKLGKTSFSELEEAKTLLSKQETSLLKRQLRELNGAIVELERQSTRKHRKQIDALLESRQNELKALENAKPKEVQKPDQQSEEQKKLGERIGTLTSLLEWLSEAGQKSVADTAEYKAQLQMAESVKERVTSLGTRTARELEEMSDELSKLGLKVSEIIELKTNTEPLDQKIQALKQSIQTLEKDNSLKFDPKFDFKTLSTIPDLRSAYAYVQSQVVDLKNQLGTPERKFQVYQERFRAWNTKRKAILGEDENPAPDSILRLTAQLEYLENSLSEKLVELHGRRKALVKKIFESKSQIVTFYRDLKQSVEGRLEAVRADGFEIQIKASFVVSVDFKREFLAQINQRKRGPFRVNADADTILTRHVRDTRWDDFDAIFEMLEQLLNIMRTHEDEDLEISEQAHDVKDFYDYLFSIEYLAARYELRLGDKNLNELSPGEKGLLLLIFYLQLDRNNTPLVIDQPEDNLDNESIFSVLATCIRDAKKNRQVVLVTHNPNLAVGADAEEVVFVQLDKAKNYEFSYESGAIENPAINQRIVDILEGSQPAFVKRRLKYGI